MCKMDRRNRKFANIQSLETVMPFDILDIIVDCNTQNEIEKKLEQCSFIQLKELMKLHKCGIENLTKKICYRNGIKYKD